MTEKEIAEAATKGKWTLGYSDGSGNEDTVVCTSSDTALAKTNWGCSCCEGDQDKQGVSNARFIAHFNPKRVLELLEARDQAADDNEYMHEMTAMFHKEGIAITQGPKDGIGALIDQRDAANALLKEALGFAESLSNTVFIVPDPPKLRNWKDAYTVRAAEGVVLAARINEHLK